MSRILVPDSGAGVSPSYVLSDSDVLEGFLQTVRATLLTSIVVGTRTVSLELRDKSQNVVAQYPALAVPHTNNLFIQYTWGGTGTDYGDANETFACVPMLPVRLFGGDLIQIVTSNIQADDLWQNMMLGVG